MRISESFGGLVSQAQARLERWMVRWPWPAGGCRRRMHYRQLQIPRPAAGTTPFLLVRAEVRLTALDTYEMSYALLSALRTVHKVQPGLLLPWTHPASRRCRWSFLLTGTAFDLLTGGMTVLSTQAR